MWRRLVPWPPTTAGDAYTQPLRAAAQQLKLRLDVYDASNHAELDAAMAAMAAISKSAARGLVVTTSDCFERHRDRLIAFAAARRLCD